LRPVPRPEGPDVRRLARVAALAALAIVGRVAFLWAPNFALTYFVVFLAGVVEGPRVGALVGLLAMTVTNLLYSGLHPVLVANGLAMALLGVLGGLLRPLVVRTPRDRLDRALAVALPAAVGLFGTFLFSVAADTVGWFVQFALTPEGRAIGTRALVPLIAAGLVFNLVPALVNLVLFGSLTPACVAALRRSGHLRPAPARTAPERVPAA